MKKEQIIQVGGSHPEERLPYYGHNKGLLSPEEIELAILPVLKNYSEANGLLGKRFIAGEITYKEYLKIMGQLAQEYEVQYHQALLQAQYNLDHPSDEELREKIINELWKANGAWMTVERAKLCADILYPLISEKKIRAEIGEELDEAVATFGSDLVTIPYQWIENLKKGKSLKE